MYKRNLREKKYVENISNAARTLFPNCLGLGDEGTTAIRYTSSECTYIRSDSHIEQYGREAARVKALRPLRGARNAALTQAFLPGPSLRHVGMRRCVANSVPFNVQDPDQDRRGHDRGQYAESFLVPVRALERMNVDPRSAVRLAGSRRSPGQRCGALFPHCERIAVFEPVQSRTAASSIYRRIHEAARGRW
jgi:hypothetical protein